MQIFPPAGFIWWYHQYLLQKKYLFASSLRSTGCSHIGSLFTNEEQKKSLLVMSSTPFPDIPVLFMMSLTRLLGTKWHTHIFLFFFCNCQSWFWTNKTRNKHLCVIFFIPFLSVGPETLFSFSSSFWLNASAICLQELPVDKINGFCIFTPEIWQSWLTITENITACTIYTQKTAEVYPPKKGWGGRKEIKKEQTLFVKDSTKITLNKINEYRTYIF